MKQFLQVPVITMLCCLSLTSETVGQTPYAFFDFEDGPPDRLVTGGGFSFENGVALLRPSGSQFTVGYVQGIPWDNVSIRARVTLLGTPNSLAFLSLWGRDDPDGVSDSYWGGIGSDRQLYIGGFTPSGAIDIHKSTSTQLDIRSEEVMLQFDLLDQEFELFAWPASPESTKPSVPQLETSDSRIAEGPQFGFGYTPNSNGEDVVAIFHWLQIAPIRGDYNADSGFTIDDLDQLTSEIATGGQTGRFDQNDDGVVDADDIERWLTDVGPALGYEGPLLGADVNLDGAVDSSDLNVLGLNWEQDVLGWSNGDLTADGRVDSSDLNAIGLYWRQQTMLTTETAGPTEFQGVATSPVPEPGMHLPILLLFLMSVRVRY